MGHVAAISSQALVTGWSRSRHEGGYRDPTSGIVSGADDYPAKRFSLDVHPGRLRLLERRGPTFPVCEFPLALTGGQLSCRSRLIGSD